MIGALSVWESASGFWDVFLKDGGNRGEVFKGPRSLLWDGDVQVGGCRLCCLLGSWPLLSPSSWLLHVHVLSTVYVSGGCHEHPSRVLQKLASGPQLPGGPGEGAGRCRCWESWVTQALRLALELTRCVERPGTMQHPLERALMEGWGSESGFDLQGVCVVRRQAKKCCCWGQFML